MHSMLQFAMHYGHYRQWYHYNITQRRRRGTPTTTPMPAIDLVALLDDKEENLRPQQMNVTHTSIMELLGNPGNPLYAEPHSMAEYFDALVAGTRAIGELPGHMRCKDGNAMVRVHDEEAMQVRQKILRCLDMRVLDGDLVVLTCLRTPTLILPTGRFMQLYFNPDRQGQYAFKFPENGQGFLQPRRDIRASIVPRDFRQLPVDMRELIDYYFHREELQARAEAEEEESMSTDTEAAETIRQLNLQCSESTESLQIALREVLAPATAPRPIKEEYYYDSDDSVVDLDEQYPELKERIVQWQATQRGAASAPPWCPPNFGQEERAALSCLPDLREILDQARATRVADQIPVQSVAPMPLPFISMRGPGLPTPVVPRSDRG